MSERMTVETRSRQGLRLEQAARAAWLYYVGRRTQDEVAGQLNISRQAAQRLISLALSEKLIKFRFDHEVGPCMEAGDALSRRFGLSLCEVVPTMGSNTATLGSVAIAGGAVPGEVALTARASCAGPWHRPHAACHRARTFAGCCAAT